MYLKVNDFEYQKFMKEIIIDRKFEQKIETQPDTSTTTNCAQIGLSLGKLAMRFARVERVPRYKDGERESDVEHSFMLGLMAPELAMALELPLDVGLVALYANVHDLIKLKTGDVATFLLNHEEMTEKEAIEHAALDELVQELPPYTAVLLLRYESQSDPEARFVRAVDKLLPVIVDIIGDGRRVMVEDYGVLSPAELVACHRELHARLVKKFGEEFPELMLAHQLLTELFEAKFSETP